MEAEQAHQQDGGHQQRCGDGPQDERAGRIHGAPAGRVGAARGRPDRDLHAALQAIEAVGDHVFAGLDAGHRRRFAVDRGDLDCAGLHGAVRLHDVDEAWRRSTGRRRTGSCPPGPKSSGAGGRYELVWVKLVGLPFGKTARALTVPVVGSIWLSSVNRVPVASCLLGSVQRQDLQRLALAHLREHIGEAVLRDRENHGDRLQLRDRRQRHRAVGLDDFPGSTSRRPTRPSIGDTIRV